MQKVLAVFFVHLEKPLSCVCTLQFFSRLQCNFCFFVALPARGKIAACIMPTRDRNDISQRKKLLQKIKKF